MLEESILAYNWIYQLMAADMQKGALHIAPYANWVMGAEEECNEFRWWRQCRVAEIKERIRQW